MDINTLIMVVMMLLCAVVWSPIVVVIFQHREQMRMMREKHESYKRRVKAEVEQQIREFSGDMDYELGGEINWQRNEKGG